MTAARINLTIPADLKAALDRLPGGLNYSSCGWREEAARLGVEEGLEK